MKKNKLLALSLIFLVSFIFISLNLDSVFINSLDNSINSFTATHQISFLQNLSIILSNLFEPAYVIMFVTVLSVFLWIYKKKRQAIILASTSILGGISIYVLKHILTQARPTNAIIVDSGFSFPSGHALISAVLFGIFIYFSLNIKSQTRKVISISACVLGILLVGLSRVYLNVHWFYDVIAGYCFGLFLVLISLHIQERFGKKNLKSKNK